MNLAPSQGGWVEFTLDQEGNYPFVTHAFGDMVKGAAGILHTTGAPMPPKPAAAPAADAAPPHAMAGAVKVALGDMWVKADKTTVKAGEVTFDVTEHRRHDARPGDRQGSGSRQGRACSTSRAFLAKGKDLAGGEGGDMITADLKPGSYELVCFVPGHYAAGQRSDFTVTG